MPTITPLTTSAGVTGYPTPAVPAGGSVLVDNDSPAPLFVSDRPFTMSGRAPAAGFVGYVVEPNTSGLVLLTPQGTTPPTLYVAALAGAAGATFILSPAPVTAASPTRWAFATLTANTAAVVPLDGVLGRTAGEVLAGCIDGAWSATGDGTTPVVNGSSGYLIDGRRHPVKIAVTYLPVGVPSLRVISAGPALVTITSV